MNILEKIGKELLYFDGAMGTMLQKNGLKPGEKPEPLNFTRPELIENIHKMYLEAGANIIKSNSFGANAFKIENFEGTVKEAVLIAKRASVGFKNSYVAVDMGPTGCLMEPYGTLGFDDCVENYEKMAMAGKDGGADLVLIETMADTYELKAAVLGAKKSGLPVFATVTPDENARLLCGADMRVVGTMLEDLGAAAVGLNCGLGPKEAKNAFLSLLSATSLPVILNPNAGMPVIKDGETSFMVDEHEFSDLMLSLLKEGAAVLGGCCGTTPLHIKETVLKTKGIFEHKKREVPFAVCSYLVYQEINEDTTYFHSTKTDIDSIADELLDASEDILVIYPDLVDMPTKDLILELSTLVKKPLAIKSENEETIKEAKKYYNGKLLVL